MSSDGSWVVRCRQLSKVYNLYRRPADRLYQMLIRGNRRLYTPVEAVRQLDLKIHRGESFGIVGRNGSGKSTFLQLICGTLTPSLGELEVRGRVAALLELGAGFDPNFTGRENVYVSGTVLGLSEAQIEERLEDILAFANIGQFVDQPVKNYSSGMFARLAFAVAIHVDADILVVDEALAVGDEAFQRKCFARIEKLKEQGCTIILVSHSAGMVIELCDRAMLMDSGECLMIDRPKEVVEAYHRLLFAAPDDAETQRGEIKRDYARSGEGAERTGGTHEVEETDEARFDPNLVPESTVEYDSRGCQIHEVEIRDRLGRRVNQLRMGRSYFYTYRVHFLRACRRVRFGMMVKSLNGWEIGGSVSHPQGSGIEQIEAGSEWSVSFHFNVPLIPGTYFLNAGVTGWEPHGETYLHRLIDAAMFRVEPVVRSQVTGHVDLSTAPICTFEKLDAPLRESHAPEADDSNGGDP